MEINPNQLGISAFNRTTSELRVIVYTAAIQERDSLEKADGNGVFKGKSFPECRAGLEKLVPPFLFLRFWFPLIIFHFVVGRGRNQAPFDAGVRDAESLPLGVAL